MTVTSTVAITALICVSVILVAYIIKGGKK